SCGFLSTFLRHPYAFLESPPSTDRRMGKTVQGVTTDFVYNTLNPVQEMAGATVMANLLTELGINEFSQRTDGVGLSALLTDALGSTVASALEGGTGRFRRSTPKSHSIRVYGLDIDWTGEQQ